MVRRLSGGTEDAIPWIPLAGPTSRRTADTAVSRILPSRATICAVASALVYLVVVLAVAALIYLLASLVFGRGEELEPLPPGATPTRLPATGVGGSDVRSLRFQQVFRGYKASEVDWALERLATEVESLHGRVAVLERALAERSGEDEDQGGRDDRGGEERGGRDNDRTGEEHR